MKQATLRAAFVGTGWWGRELARAAHALGDCITVAGFCSLLADDAAALCKEHGGVAYADYDAVLRDASVQAVVLATPHSLHVGQVVQAAAAGKHVFVEKPLALSVADADHAVAACARAARVLAVGHNRRFMPAARRMRELVGAGACGRIVHVEANYSGNMGLSLPAQHWRSQRAEMPGAGTAPMGLHMIDTLQWILGPIARLASIGKRQVATQDLDDTSVTLFEFAGGATGTLASNLCSTLTADLRLYGTSAKLEARGNFASLALDPAGESGGHWDFPQDDSVRDELRAFAEACTGRAAYPLPPADAVRNVAVMEAIERSARAGSAWTVVAQ